MKIDINEKEPFFWPENRYKHYDRETAFHEIDEGRAVMYQVTTINGTLATNRKGKIDKNKVHKNEYIIPLSNLIDFIRGTVLVNEKIVSMFPLGPVITYDNGLEKIMKEMKKYK